MQQIDIIKAPVADHVEDFHSQFNEILATKSEWLQDAIDRLNASTGKKVRPILVALMAGMIAGGDPPKSSIEAAVLLELIHTATLIHDDVIDEASTRRGQPTLNVLYDNRVAVLMGDFVLSSALIGAISLGDLEVIQIISGIGRELTEGEIRQFESADSLRLSEKNYYDIIRQKTAVLFASCARIAGIMTGASTQDKERLTQIGEYLGMAFQIRDDIFDYYSNDVGKPTGNDLREGKITLPLLQTLLETEGTAEGDHCLELLRERPITEAAVAHLTHYAIEHGGITYAETRLADYIHRAKELLYSYPESIYRSSLIALSDYIGSRTH